MGTGFKDYSNYTLIKKHGASAHAVLQIRRHGKKDTDWFLKELDSAQEAQIECMTGEIYRYFLGPDQPKIRVRDAHTVVSEAVRFVSFRELLEKPENKNNNAIYDKYKKAFQDDLDGFMMVLLSSIFFEENDLSDNNYGLVVVSGEGNARTFGGFVKIDHGQSFNTLRIQEAARTAGVFDVKKKMLDHASIKYFPPISPIPARDRRVKSDRCTTGLLSSRQYLLSHSFLDRIVTDFLDARITKDYILNLAYQPSALPFYDARLLSFFDYRDEPSPYTLLEYSKYLAIARLAFTSDFAYLHIASRASDMDKVPRIWVDVQKKILQNREHLLNEMKKDPDFLLFCHTMENHIKDLLEAAWKRMVQGSERYGTATASPLDYASLRAFKALAADYEKSDFIRQSEEYLGAVRQFIESYAWSTGFGGGKSVLLAGKSKKVPSHVATMVELLDLYQKCGLIRLIRSVRDLVEIIHKACTSTSSSRKKSTTDAYTALKSTVQAYALNLKSAGVSLAAIERIHPLLKTFL